MSALAPARPLEAHEPPEALGRSRGDVALLVASRSGGELVHGSFHELWRFVGPGDLLVVNTSATLAAALPGRLDGQAVELRLSTPAADDHWVIELRTADRGRYGPPPIGARVELPAGARADLLAPYAGGERLCLARLSLPRRLEDYLRDHGRAIRYDHVGRAWPIDAYQTVFALDPGSAEMPSAGRPFSTELVTSLVARGVLIAPVMLHTGVSSLEPGETPYPERYRVPAATARLANAVHSWGGRIIAVGTTVVRALETVVGPDGALAPGTGSTDLVVTPERGLRAVDGLLTGWHEPESSHLKLLEAAAGADLLERSYRAAHARGYRWHEFGDAHLILP
ncbi:MAG: S-adenosylmethionine:tRNA ribosyltransferase-isomerase [Thermoleophilaceae bacterium]|jgi:S-adenosylmethionine:tRNA ribosyltransferase-isomerase|nr:S-adenosylmethionine:tRNA ribosyltransferase-isomerase [Thermoleophilaceae bacterium]